MIPLNLVDGVTPMPEFVTLQMVGNRIGRDVKFLNKIHISAGVPSKLIECGKRVYRWSEIKKRLIYNKIMPPDANHPFRRHTCAEAAALLGIEEIRVKKWLKTGKLKATRVWVDGRKYSFIYRKDIDWFRRNYERKTLINRMRRPIRLGDMCTLMDITRGTYNHRLKNEILPLPRGYREARKYDQTTLTKYVDDHIRTKARYRRNPMPSWMKREMARIYLGVSDSKMDDLLDKGKIWATRIETRPGKFSYMYAKSMLDDYLLYVDCRSCYCDGLPFYTKKGIQMKFSKTERWVEEYIVDKCRLSDVNGFPFELGVHRMKGHYACGWVREDVEAAVAKGGDEHIDMYDYANDKELERARRKHAAELARDKSLRNAEREKERDRKARELAREKEREKKKRKEASAKERARKERIRQRERYRREHPEILYHNPADQIAEAIDAGFAERKEEQRKKMFAATIKGLERRRGRDEIAMLLNLETDFPIKNAAKWTRLKYSDQREIFTIVFFRTTKVSMLDSYKYGKFRHEGDEYIIKINDRTEVSRRQRADTSIPKLIGKGIAAIQKMDMKYLPAWVIITPCTSYVPEQRFLEILRNVPSEYGAVAPFGYEFMMPDGSYDTCPKTYGLYSMYYANRPGNEFVVGSSVGEIHEVAVMDGPFVAVRGETLFAMGDLQYFGALGECRSMIGPIISAVCRRRAIKMGVVPVNSVCCGDYVLLLHSVEWNKVIDRITAYAVADRP